MTNMVSVEKLFARIDDNLADMERDIAEYIDHEEYTLEEQMYDEGYMNALHWVSLMISETLMKE